LNFVCSSSLIFSLKLQCFPQTSFSPLPRVSVQVLLNMLSTASPSLPPATMKSSSFDFIFYSSPFLFGVFNSCHNFRSPRYFLWPPPSTTSLFFRPKILPPCLRKFCVCYYCVFSRPLLRFFSISGTHVCMSLGPI